MPCWPKGITLGLLEKPPFDPKLAHGTSTDSTQGLATAQEDYAQLIKSLWTGCAQGEGACLWGGGVFF